jgi:hypothetical protein
MSNFLPQILPLLIPLVVLALILRRSARGRKLRVERLWIVPLVALVGGLAVVILQPATGAFALAIQAAALALGGVVGWWRGAFTRLTVDPQTHKVTSKASTAGIVLVMAAFLVRYAARFFLREESNSLHLTAALITDAFLLFAVGVITMQRLEIWLRCSKLLAEARAAKSEAPVTSTTP